MSTQKVAPDLDPERQRIGATLRALREKTGLRADQAANALRPPKSRSYVANIEAGRKPLTPVLLAQFADMYDVPQVAIMKPELLGDAPFRAAS